MARKAAKKGAGRENPAEKPVAKSDAVATMPGRNGGTLRRGGSNKGGTGRPPSAIRDALRGSFDSRIQVLTEIADGKPMQRARFNPIELVPYVVCANCGESEIKIKDYEDAITGEINMEVSASPKDRISAIDMLAKYGLGALKEVSADHVRQKLEQTLDILQTLTSADQYTRIVRELQPVWSA